MAPGLPTTSRTSPECRRSASPASPGEPHRRGRRKDGVMSAINDLDDFKALDPFFRIIEQGLDGLANGGHFFDILAEDVLFDYVSTVPHYPPPTQARHAVAELYRPHGPTLSLHPSPAPSAPH